MLNKAIAKLVYEGRKFGHMRFEEPIIVFESDDWGKVNTNQTAVFKKEYGHRTQWSYDQLESPNECEHLFQTLSKYKDDFERPPKFTANIIVSNPDTEATREKAFKEIVLKPVDKSNPELIDAWKTGIGEEVFYPQYHGRLHYNYRRYQRDLEKNDVARALFLQGVNGGLEHFKATNTAYYSEYQDYQTEESTAELRTWISDGLKEFQRIFGYQSKSTIAPNYVLHPATIPVFSGTGVNYIQGCNKLFHMVNGHEQFTNYCQGKALVGGLIALARNHKFEPCRKNEKWEAEFTRLSSQNLIDAHVPVVLDTHRFNYVSTFARHSLGQLDSLLKSFTKIKGVQFLTSPELGEAIANKGSYTDVFSGKKKQLTPIDSPTRRMFRTWIK